MPPLQQSGLSETELRTLVRQYRKQNWHGIQTPQWQERIVDDIVHDDGEYILRAGYRILGSRQTELLCWTSAPASAASWSGLPEARFSRFRNRA